MKLLGLILLVLLFLNACSSTPCPETKITNMTPFAWNSHDQKLYDFNKGFCERKYGPLKACMKNFYKTDIQSYHIICGRE